MTTELKRPSDTVEGPGDVEPRRLLVQVKCLYLQFVRF